MTVTIESFQVSTTDLFGFDPPVSGGYSSPNSGVDVLTNGDLTIFNGLLVRSLLWLGASDELIFEVFGCHENAGWDWINFNGTNYPRTSAVYGCNFNTSLSTGPYTTWTWSNISTFPFSAQNSTETINIQHDGFVSAFGAIDLNAIHREAGGLSEFSVTINDADVRAKSWYATVKGATPANGATQKFTDFYFPSHMADVDYSGGTPTTKPVRRCGSGYTGNLLDTARVSSQVAYVASYTTNMDAFQGMSVRTDGTDSGIYLHCGSTYGAGLTIRKYFLDGTSVTNFTTTPAIILEDTVIEEASLETDVFTSTIDGTYGSGPTVQGLTFTAGITTSYMSTNSATAFTNLTTNTYHGRGYKISLGPISQYTYGWWDCWCRVRYTFRVRISPTGSRCLLTKGENTLAFVVYSSNYVYHIDPSDPNLPDPGPGGQ